MRIPPILVLGTLVLAPPAAAQRLTPSAFPSYELPAQDPGLEPRVEEGPGDEAASEGSVIFGSIMGGLGGMWIGAFLGSRFAETPCEDCGMLEGLYGAGIGFGLGASGGAHLANHEQGPFGKSALITVAIGVVGVAMAVGTERAEILLAVPIAQVATAVAIERGYQHK